MLQCKQQLRLFHIFQWFRFSDIFGCESWINIPYFICTRGIHRTKKNNISALVRTYVKFCILLSILKSFFYSWIIVTVRQLIKITQGVYKANEEIFVRTFKGLERFASLFVVKLNAIQPTIFDYLYFYSIIKMFCDIENNALQLRTYKNIYEIKCCRRFL